MASIKGFTLFTALVAFALIALTALLIQGMIKAERDSLTLLNNIEEQSDLQAIADLERADAINTLNLSLRFTLEDYFSDTESGGVLNLQGKSWTELKKNFATVYFAGGVDAAGRETGTQFATRLAKQLEDSLGATRQIGQNTITFEKDEQKTIEALNSDFVNNVNNNDFFQVVTDGECSRGEASCIGTFYITLDTSPEKLSDEDYEKLPKVVVKNLQTGRTIKQAILPRGKFRFYVPLRFFKALGEAYNLAKTNDDVKNDFGLLSVRIHNELEEMRIGFCDPGYCAPRTNPFTPPAAKDLIGASCPDRPEKTQAEFELDCTPAMQAKGLCKTIGARNSGINYNAKETDATTIPNFQELVKKRICKVIDDTSFASNELIQNSDFKLIGSSDACNGKVSSFDITIKDVKTKHGNTREQAAPTPLLEQSAGEYSANIATANVCPLIQSIGNGRFGELGLFEKTVEGRTTIQNPAEELTISENIAGADMGICNELISYTITLKFKEANENYVVNKQLLKEENRSKAYIIKLRDVFVPYTESYGVRNIKNNCLLNEDPINSFNPNARATECYSFSDNGCFTHER